MIANLYAKNEKLIKYAFCGGFGVLSDILVYSLLIYFVVNYQFANALGYLTGTLISFFLNRQHTFKLKNKVWTRLVKFMLVAFVGYLSSALLLHILIDDVGFDAIIAKLITLLFVLFTQFYLNKQFTFKASK